MPEFSTCPQCGNNVQASWRCCPFCTALLAGAEESQPALEAEGENPARSEIRADTGWIGISLILLGFLAFLGMTALVFQSAISPQTGLGIGLTLAIIVLIGSVLGVAGKKGEARVASGCLGGAAIAAIAFFTGILAVVAAIASFLESCGKIGR